MIRFSRYIRLYGMISGVLLLSGIVSLVLWGLKPAVDFTGGTLVEVAFDVPVAEEQIGTIAENTGLSMVSIQTSGENVYVMRFKYTEDDLVDQFTTVLETSTDASLSLLRNETVGPTIGAELFRKTIIATLLAIGVILAYIAYAFKNMKYGAAAIVALLHDFLIVVGAFAILGRLFDVEVDTLFVTAVLTTMSFSVHDTIVVFDRIREHLKRKERVSFEDVCDTALTETMGRSLTNSFTIIFMLLSLALLGGVTIRWFVIALLIGTISGTYSSPFVATPTLILLDRWQKRRR